MEKNEANRIFEILSEMFPNAHCELIYNNLFELLVATILSAQTTDIKVNKVTSVLFSKYPNPFALQFADICDVEKIIKPLGLYKNKAINIINLSKILASEYQGVVPNNYDILIKLPGVGRKTANVVLSEGFDIPRIAVDTHVLRVSNRLGLSLKNNPNDVEEDLMNLFDKKIWKDVHLKLLFFGRYFCKAKNPNCDECFNKSNCHTKNDK